MKKAVDDAIAEGAGDEGLNPGEMFSVMRRRPLHGDHRLHRRLRRLRELASAVKTADERDGNVMIERGGGWHVHRHGHREGVDVRVFGGGDSADFRMNSAEVDFDVTVVNKKLMVTVAADPMDGRRGRNLDDHRDCRGAGPSTPTTAPSRSTCRSTATPRSRRSRSPSRRGT